MKQRANVQTAAAQSAARWFARGFCAIAVSCILLPGDVVAAERKIEELIGIIKNVDRFGAGHTEATAAVRELSARGPQTLLPILAGMQNANPLAANWLRGAFEAVADRTRSADQSLPAAELEKFVASRDEDARARRLAYEWLIQVDAKARDRLIADMLTDLSPEFRRDAVSHFLKRADSFTESGEPDKAKHALEQALRGAVHDDQVRQIAKALEPHGQKVDVQRHYGFIADWKIIGPFPNKERKGFDAVFPPEKKLDFKARHKGLLGEVAWQEIQSKDDYGLINVAEEFEDYKESLMYLTADFESEAAQDVVFRLGTPNAWKLWVNGELVFRRDEYHRSSALDQFRVAGKLKPGTNTLLLKICQNEQTQSWAAKYQVQLRVCDSAGAGILPVEKKK